MQATTDTTGQLPAIANLPPADRAMIALSTKTVEAQLRALVKESADIQAVTDKAGREQAHAAAMKLKNTRIAIEKTGKAARDDANAFSAAVIAEEKRLKAITDAEEKRLFALRDAYDAEQARIKAEADRQERERVAAIKAKIECIRKIPFAMTGAPASTMAEELEALRAFVPGEDFAEFADEARAAAATAVEALAGMHQRQVDQEAEAERLRIERERLEQERKDREADEERLRAEREAFEEERRRFQEERAAATQQPAAEPAQATQPVQECVAEPAAPLGDECSPVQTGQQPTAETAMPETIADVFKEEDTAEGLLREFVAVMDRVGPFEMVNEFEQSELEAIAARARAILI